MCRILIRLSKVLIRLSKVLKDKMPKMNLKFYQFCARECYTLIKLISQQVIETTSRFFVCLIIQKITAADDLKGFGHHIIARDGIYTAYK